MGVVRHGNGVVDRRSVPAVLLPVELSVELQQGAHHFPDPAFEPLRVRRREQRLVRHVEPDHGHVDSSCEHTRSRFRIGPDVELGGGRDVSLCNCAAHEDDALRSRVGVEREQQRDVRQRPGRDERYCPVACAELVGQEIRSVLRDGRALRRR